MPSRIAESILSKRPWFTSSQIAEYAAVSGTVDVYATNSGHSGTLTTGTTSTTTVSNELLVGFCGGLNGDSSNAAMSSPTNGFTMLDGADWGSGGVYHLALALLELIVATTQTASSGVSVGQSDTWWSGGIITLACTTWSPPNNFTGIGTITAFLRNMFPKLPRKLTVQAPMIQPSAINVYWVDTYEAAPD